MSHPARCHSETLALHGGSFRADPTTGAVVPPIYLTTSYQFHDTGHAERMFALEEVGFTYTRTGNPTRDIGERRVAALEGGGGALIVASGTAARLYALLNLAGAGDNLVVAHDIFDARGLVGLLAGLSVEVRLADPGDPESFARASDCRTRAYFAESFGTEGLERFPVAAVAVAGRRLGIPLMIDNSAAPLALRPLEEGAAVVVYSDLGYLAGFAGLTAGLIVDGGNFDWEGAECPSLSRPDDSYHGAVWTQVAARFGVPLAYLIRLRMRLLRDFGAAVSPVDAFHLIEGLETVALRVQAHAANAGRFASWLEGRRQVALVKSTRDGAGRVAGGLVQVHFKDRVAIDRLRDALSLFRKDGSIGRASAALPGPRGLFRLSVGLEHPADLEADFAQALDRL